MRPHVLLCARCGREVTLDPAFGVCGTCTRSILRPALLEVCYREAVPSLPAVPDRDQGIWAFAGLLPAAGIGHRLTLGEGHTPLQRARRLGRELGLPELWLKNETVNPTGSFKDRMAALSISRAAADGARGILVVSSGNMSSSMGAYSAAAGLPVTVVVSPTANPARLEQFRLTGAEIEVVPGGDEAKMTAAVALARSRDRCNVTAPYYPLGIEAVKTIAYEMVAQLGRVPGVVAVPTGYGSLATAFHRAFEEMKAMGRVDRMPRLLAVQSAASPSVVDAFDRGLEEAEPGPATSICSGINQEVTLQSRAVLAALRATGGGAVAVPDAAILAARARIARTEGILVEPTGAAAVAGLTAAPGLLRPGEPVVAVLTGTGIRA